MLSKKQRQVNDEADLRRRSPRPATENFDVPARRQISHPGAITRRDTPAPESLTVRDVFQLQRAVGNRAVGRLLARTATHQPVREKENNTGLPDNLKSGVENLSGMSLDDVKVHRNSDKPTQLQAHAYTQGTEIHLGPEQERHLPHEAWHVVQQKQGRVRPTAQLKGRVSVNDDAELEKEADVMGAKALQMSGQEEAGQLQTPKASYGSTQTVQRVIKVASGKKTDTYNNVSKVKNSKFYKDLIKVQPYAGRIKDVDYWLGQYNSANLEFESYDQLKDYLDDDLQSKSVDPSKPTAQEEFFTRGGWKKKYSAKYSKNYANTQNVSFWDTYESGGGGGNPLEIVEQELGKVSKSTVQLKVYRTMFADEATKILAGDYSTLGAHLGDYKQTLNYFYKGGTAGKRLLEFTLKPGAHELLFSPKITAMGQTGKTTAVIADYVKREGGGGFAKANENEGTLPGYIGIKSEEHGESGFSLAIGDKDSKELFKKLVANVSVVKNGN